MVLDRDSHWTLVPGTVDIMVGKSSEDIVLSRKFFALAAQNSLTRQKSSR